MRFKVFVILALGVFLVFFVIIEIREKDQENGTAQMIYSTSKVNSIFDMSEEDVKATPPYSPSGVSAETYGNRIRLSWIPLNLDTINNYNIYRQSIGWIPNNNMEIIGAVQNPPFIDTTIEKGQHYKYGVKAVDAYGNESPMSRTVRVDF